MKHTHGRGRAARGFCVTATLVLVAALQALTNAPASAATAASPTAAPVGPGSAFAATEAAYATQPVEWFECDPSVNRPDFECAFVLVPKDWDRPAVGEFTMLISRVAASDPSRRHGSLLLNQGGPGAQGWYLPYYASDVDPQIAAVYDMVGFDPRGVGYSSALECADPALRFAKHTLEANNPSPRDLLRAVQLTSQWAQECSSHPDTRYVNSYQTVRDMDLIRALLGEAKISYNGESAGTYLGAWYATTFPDRADRFLLDANEDWTAPWSEIFPAAHRGFQRAFDDAFVPWLAGGDATYHLGTTPAQVRATISARRAALVAHPATLPDGTVIDARSYDTGINALLYKTVLYPYLGGALSAVERLDTATADELALAAYSFGYQVPLTLTHDVDPMIAIRCQDTRSPSVPGTIATWLIDRVRYPLIGKYGPQECAFWATPPTGSPVTGRGMPPVLMVQNTGDPATPYDGGLRAHRKTPGSRLLTVVDEYSHAAFNLMGNACVDSYGRDWLINGRLPRRDVTCQGNPLPDYEIPALPSAAAAAAGQSPSTGPLERPALKLDPDRVARFGPATR